MSDVIKVRKTPEFEEWFSELSSKEQAQVDARFYRISEFHHFGDFKLLEGLDIPLFELRWKNGWRIYFFRDGVTAILVLLGGMKNGQKKDIKKAENLFRRYANYKK
jgi:putative addiction module killer protein